MIIFIPSFITLSSLEKRNFQINLILDGLNVIFLLLMIIFSRFKTGLNIEKGIIYKGFYFAQKLIINTTKFNVSNLTVNISKRLNIQRISFSVLDGIKTGLKSEIYVIKLNNKFLLSLKSQKMTNELREFLQSNMNINLSSKI